MHARGQHCPKGLFDPATGWPEIDDPWEELYEQIPERERRGPSVRILQDQTDREANFRERNRSK